MSRKQKRKDWCEGCKNKTTSPVCFGDQIIGEGESCKLGKVKGHCTDYERK